MRHVDPVTAAADAIPADPALADPHTAAHAIVERQLAMLTELAEIGMTIARAAGQWAVEAGEGAAEPVRPDGFRGDPGLAYSRAARAVRLTLMLQTRLLKDLPALGRAETLARMGAEQSRREHAHRLTVRAIRAEHDDAEAVEQLSDEAWERLRDEDLSDDLGARPFGEVVARICRDLGLSPEQGAWAFPPTSSSGEAQRRPEDPATPVPKLGDVVKARPPAPALTDDDLSDANPPPSLPLAMRTKRE